MPHPPRLFLAIISAVSLCAVSGCGLMPSADEAQEELLGEEGALSEAEALLNEYTGTQSNSAEEREDGQDSAEGEGEDSEED